MAHVSCFVMQAFDGGAYDRRFEETFAPAIAKGGAKALRADKILGTKPIIDKIETALRAADIAFAEISENNPNVFIELGYALNLGIPLVMACDAAKRGVLPFDITHRPVIFYKTESQGDFERLSNDVEIAVKAAITEAADRGLSLPVSVATRAPLQQDELKTRIMLEILDAQMTDPDGLSAYGIKKALSAAGTPERVTSLATMKLLSEGMIHAEKMTDYNNDEFLAYALTDHGRDLLLEQYSEIKRQAEEAAAPKVAPRSAFDVDFDDDVPF
jgi:predicted transcriptional regulator